MRKRPGTMYVTARPQTLAVLKKAATDLGITFTAATTRPTAMRSLGLCASALAIATRVDAIGLRG